MKTITIKDNTVSAVGQVTKSSETFVLGNEQAKSRILILGNSITRHGPAESIGWHGDWGMAASSIQNDYVHRLYAKLQDDVCFYVRQASDWELNYKKNENILAEFKEEKEFQANIVVFMLGENIHDVQTEQDMETFKEKLAEFLAYVSPKTAKIIFTSCVWENPLVDKVIMELANQSGQAFIDLNFIGNDGENLAIGCFEHGGVASHPGDKGMEKIATKLHEIIKKMLLY